LEKLKMSRHSKYKVKQRVHRHTSQGTRKYGLAPGSLVYTGNMEEKKSVIDIFVYAENFFLEKQEIRFEKCREYLKEKNQVIWINVEGIYDLELMESLGGDFRISNLVLEDVMNINQRAKYEDFGNYRCIFMKMLSYNETNKKIEMEHVSFIFSENYIISLQEGKEGDVFNPVRERIRTEKAKIRERGVDYLIFALLDVIVDNYFVILEKIGEEMETLDLELIENPTHRTLERIYDLKREIIYARKTIWPLREIISKMERDETSFFEERTKPYIRDLYDHIVQVIDNVETYRDIISGMMDLYLSSISNRMNEIMKVLTITGTIFIPLTFVAGVYGMNFEYMPELKAKSGYPLTLLVMLLMVIFMLFYFRRKKWIGN